MLALDEAPVGLYFKMARKALRIYARLPSVARAVN